MPIAHAQDLVRQAIRGTLYGAPKTGKTLWACRSPKPFVFDIDEGIVSVKKHGLNPGYFVPKTYKELTDTLLSMKFREDFGFDLEGETFHTCIVDTANTMYDLIMKHALTLPMNKTTENKFLVATEDRGAPREFPVLQDYGAAGAKLKFILQELKKFKCHLLVITHEHVHQLELTKALKGMPALTEKLADIIPGYYDLYLRMRTKEVTTKTDTSLRYFISSRKHEEGGIPFEAGDRFDLLDAEFDAPAGGGGFIDVIRKCGGYIEE